MTFARPRHPRPAQNIESYGLTGKILQTKDLVEALESRDWAVMIRWVGQYPRIFPTLHFPEARVKVVRHTTGGEGCGKRETFPHRDP